MGLPGVEQRSTVSAADFRVCCQTSNYTSFFSFFFDALLTAVEVVIKRDRVGLMRCCCDVADVHSWTCPFKVNNNVEHVRRW